MDILQTALALMRDVVRQQPGAADRLFMLVPELEALGTPESAYVVGTANLDVFANDAEAISWFFIAGEHGGALRSIGFMFEQGRNAAKDPSRAADYFERAANLGDALAQFKIGICYRDGNARSKNRDTALRWLRAAAEQGSVSAMTALGDLLTATDRPEAHRWYIAAAETGHVGAMRITALWHRTGHSGPVDLVQATRWYFRMFARAKREGIHEIRNLMPQLSDDQILEAAELAGDRSLGEAAIRDWRS